MPPFLQCIRRKIFPEPIQVGIGKIDTGGGVRAPECRVDGGGTGITKKVQEILALRLLRNAQAQTQEET